MRPIQRHIRAQGRDVLTLLAIACLALTCMGFVVRDARRDQWTWGLWLVSSLSLQAVVMVWKGHPNAPACDCYGGSWPDEEAKRGE